MKIKNQNSGYTILVTLMIIGFLIVLTTGVLNLVLREMNDNRGAGNYLKAYAGAEAAMELALLDIKKHGYGIYSKLDFSDNKAKILRNDIANDREMLFSYDLNSKTKTYSGSLNPYEQSVIPLFYINSNDTRTKINTLNLKILNSGIFTDDTKMAWNIVSTNGDGVGGNSEITSNIEVKGRNGSGGYLEETTNNLYRLNSFLSHFDNNYLIVINLDPSNNLEFKINSSKEFTKPISKIISSAKIGNYKQNLETTLDNTAFLSILKYSVFSQ